MKDYKWLNEQGEEVDLETLRNQIYIDAKTYNEMFVTQLKTKPFVQVEYNKSIKERIIQFFKNLI